MNLGVGELIVVMGRAAAQPGRINYLGPSWDVKDLAWNSKNEPDSMQPLRLAGGAKTKSVAAYGRPAWWLVSGKQPDQTRRDATRSPPHRASHPAVQAGPGVVAMLRIGD